MHRVRPLSAILAAARRNGVLSFASFRLQHQRTAVFSAATTGPMKALHEEVDLRFAEVAQGRPLNVSAAQLVQMLFEVGAADVRCTDVGEVMHTLTLHGFYRQTNMAKRDSRGPAPVPTVGLDECKRWATLIFLDRLKREERGEGGLAPVARIDRGRGRGGSDWAAAPACGSVWTGSLDPVLAARPGDQHPRSWE
mmetsp:Transcript_105180/g.234799  ORF Transcript_105180/g.234799 Transcript_105180/m.234799 type:complete len:195 (+) Transcript_105180:203-787(+)